MTHIYIGRPLTTNCGTLVEKYIKGGKQHKSIDFSDSTNKVAKQLGLVKRIVKYNYDKIPVEFTDTIERKITLPVRDNQPMYSPVCNIQFKRFNDKYTKCGTRYFKLIEDGKLYKYILYEESTNKIAKQQGLLTTKIKYGNDLKPIEITSTYKRSTVLPERKNKQPDNVIPKIKEETNTEENIFGNLGANSKESFYEAYRKTDRYSVLYQDYYSFIAIVKAKLEKYEKFLPKELYEDIMNRYGTEEMSIRKILKDNSFDIEEIPFLPNQLSIKIGLKKFINNTEKKEQEFAQIRLANKSEKLSVIYTNAWTDSRLRVDMGYECAKINGNLWSILREVWSKILNPEESEYKTEKLIDAYLLHMYKNRYQTGILSYNGKNPLAKYTEDKEMNKKKVFALKTMYGGVKYLAKEENRRILKKPDFQEYKNSADIEAMAKTIENFEKHYRDAFLKYFWTDERKFRFKEVLKNKIKELGEKIELSNDIYEALIKEALLN